MAHLQSPGASSNDHRVAFPRVLKTIALLVTRGIFLTSSFCAFLICATILMSVLLQAKTMVVTGGSMEPAFKAGDAVMIKSDAVDSLRVGDVIAFHAPSIPSMITHRVVAIKEIDGRTYFQTKGDTNPTPDYDLAPAEAVLGKVVFRVPGLGFLVRFVATSPGVFLVIGLPLFLMLVQEVWGLLQSRNWPQATRSPKLEDIASETPSWT